MNIKKPYAALVNFLEDNKDKKVSSILEEVKLMCESKKVMSTVIMNDDKVFAVFCYYHKQWEIVSDVPYGNNVHKQSGLTTMCKVGMSKWTKAQRDAKSAREALLDGVSSGNIAIGDIKDLQADIEAQRHIIDETDRPIGYTTEAETLEHM